MCPFSNNITQKRIDDENRANHDRAKLNGSTGDHNALDNAIREANNTPGLTVNRDGDYETTKNSDDYTGIGAWQNDTKGLYNRETDAINAAIAKQKQNNAEYDRKESDYQQKLKAYNDAQRDYQNKLAAWRNAHKSLPNANGVSSSEIMQELTLGREPDAVISSPGKTPYTVGGSRNHDLGIDSKTGVGLTSDGTVTYTNLHNSYYYDQNGNKLGISKIVAHFSNFEANPHGDASDMNVQIYSDPTDGFWYHNINAVTVEYQYYDQNGKLISFSPNTAFLAAGSLNSNIKMIQNGRREGVEVLNGQAIALLGSAIAKSGDYLYASPNYDDLDERTVHDDGSTTLNGMNWDNTGKYKYFGSGLIGLSGNSAKIKFVTYRQGNNNEGTWATVSTVIPTTPGPNYTGPKHPTAPTRETSTISYHYNKLNVNSIPDKFTTVHYHYDVFRFSVKARTLPYISL